MGVPRLAIPLLLLAGCMTPDYPMDKPGTWSVPPVSSNDANLRAMVANPQDLVAGRGEPNSLGAESARPATLLFSGQRAKLPDTSASAIYAVPVDNGGGNGAGNQ